MTTIGWLPAAAEELFGTEATAEESYDVLTVDVPPATWLTALRVARDELGCTYFDWLSAVDEPGTGFRVSAHVVALSPVRRLLVRTTVPHESPALASAVDVYAGAAWHERETHEMFGVAFDGHPALDHLLLPETFEGHPLRKDFVLAARVAKAWPGAKEPGESDHGGPKRRQTLPPGVPDPNEWGPQKGQLPPAPARPTRAAGRAPGRAAVERPGQAPADRPARAAGERPPRRARTAAEGSASQAGTGQAGTGPAGTGPAEGPSAPATDAATPAPAPASPRRNRTASQGSASQQSATTPEQQSQPPSDDRSEGETATPPTAPTAPRSPDAPWHHARPAFDAPESSPESSPEPTSESAERTSESTESASESASGTEQAADPDAVPKAPAPEDPAGGPQ
ncbi:NADH-quinone oxidoreductase subunit C [Streptomyces sp. NPDC092369]|uniref:NADH-quinone oxidoreductase subunit C n=1 Tax=Streptomyces sp. NPDC092369 TaxID=3366015 RepID=UPI003819CCE7